MLKNEIIKESVISISNDPEFWYDINVNNDYAINNHNKIIDIIKSDKKILQGIADGIEYDYKQEFFDPILGNDFLNEMLIAHTILTGYINRS